MTKNGGIMLHLCVFVCVSASFAECRYVAVDLVGHGLSSHRPAGVLYSLVEYVVDVRRVADGV